MSCLGKAGTGKREEGLQNSMAVWGSHTSTMRSPGAMFALDTSNTLNYIVTWFMSTARKRKLWVKLSYGKEQAQSWHHTLLIKQRFRIYILSWIPFDLYFISKLHYSWNFSFLLKFHVQDDSIIYLYHCSYFEQWNMYFILSWTKC